MYKELENGFLSKMITCEPKAGQKEQKITKGNGSRRATQKSTISVSDLKLNVSIEGLIMCTRIEHPSAQCSDSLSGDEPFPALKQI